MILVVRARRAERTVALDKLVQMMGTMEKVQTHGYGSRERKTGLFWFWVGGGGCVKINGTRNEELIMLMWAVVE